MEISKKKIKDYFGAALAVYLVMFLLYFWVVRTYFSGQADDFARSGVFGDMFGGFNALFAGLGFIAVAITTYLQLEQYKENYETSHRYQVENTFFNMLTTLREIVSSSYVTWGPWGQVLNLAHLDSQSLYFSVLPKANILLTTE